MTTMTTRRIFCWLLLLLAAVTVYRYYQVISDITIVAYKFTKLHWSKELIAEFRIDNHRVVIYAEPQDEKRLKFTNLNLQKLESIIKEARNDYQVFLKTNYQEIFWDDPEIIKKHLPSNLIIVFVTPETYQYQEIIRGEKSAGHVDIFNIVYLKTYKNNYQLEGIKHIIRHEIFHYLNNCYGITNKFEEVAARRFGVN